MWKKRKEIEGVSMGPLIALKASLFERQFTERQSKAAGGEKQKKPKVSKPLSDGLGKSNRGLEERNRRDLEQLKKEADSKNVEERLKEKAALYEKLQSGTAELNDEDEEKGPLVDFLRKTYADVQKKKHQSGRSDSDSESDSSSSRRRAGRNRDNYAQDRDRDRDRDRNSGSDRERGEGARSRWEREAEEKRREEEMEQLQKQQQIHLIEQIRDQTNRSRQRHQQQKARRQELMDKRLERIKARMANQSESKAESSSEEEDDEAADSEEERKTAVATLYDPFDETEDVLAELEAKQQKQQK